MAEHRTRHEAEAAADDWEDPGYSALPPEGSTCICGEIAHAVVVMQTGVDKCESCGNEKAVTQEIHLCDIHNDLRMQGKLDGGKLLLAHRLHVAGGLKSMAKAERDQTLELVLGVADPGSIQRVWASDASGVSLLERTDSERLTAQLQKTLTPKAANGEAK